MENKEINDPENYYKMAEPFENNEICEKALEGFHKEVADLRKKYKIRDLLIVISDNLRYEDGKVGEFIQYGSFGNALNRLPMAAYIFGRMQSEDKERISKLLAGNTNI